MKSRCLQTNINILIIYFFPVRMYQFDEKWLPNNFMQRNVTGRWLIPQIMIFNDATHFLLI